MFLISVQILLSILYQIWWGTHSVKRHPWHKSSHYTLPNQITKLSQDKRVIEPSNLLHRLFPNIFVPKGKSISFKSLELNVRMTATVETIAKPKCRKVWRFPFPEKVDHRISNAHIQKKLKWASFATMTAVTKIEIFRLNILNIQAHPNQKKLLR